MSEGDLNVQSSFPSLDPEKQVTIAALEGQIHKDIYDIDTWLELLSVIRQVTPITDSCRQIYERFFEVYPTSAPQWKLYIEHELESLCFDKVDAILSRCLLTCPDVDLWLTYINYIRICKRGLEDEYLQVERAFKSAVLHVGSDVNALPVWKEYVAFLSSIPVQNAYDQQESRTHIRKVFQNALQIPMARLDVLFRAYDEFEYSVSSSAVAQANVTEIAKKHVSTNAIAIQRQKLASNIPSFRPPCPISRPEHVSQWPAWKAFIEYEQTNPQRLEKTPLRKRVLYTFKRASLACCHVPQFWYAYANYVQTTSNLSVHDTNNSNAGADESTECMKVWQEAIKMMPYSVLIRLLYADYLETLKKTAMAKQVYEDMIVDETATTVAPTIVTKSETTTLTPTSSPPSEPASQPLKITHTPPIVWVHYLLFTRRTEGTRPYRELFQRSRKFPLNKQFPNDGWQSYVAAATIERYADAPLRSADESLVAAKILHIGSEKFPQELGMMQALLDHLENSGDYTNLKTACEKLLDTIEKSCGLTTSNLTEMSPEVSHKLRNHATYLSVWERYLRLHRYLCEPLQKIISLQHRRALILGTLVTIESLEAIESRDKAAPVHTGHMHHMMGETRVTQLLTSIESSNNAAGMSETDIGEMFAKLSMKDCIERYSVFGLSPCNTVTLQSIEADGKRTSEKQNKKTAAASGKQPSGHTRGVLRCATDKQRLQALLQSMTQPNTGKMTIFTRVLAAQFPLASSAAFGAERSQISTFMAIDPRERAPPLTITEYKSSDETNIPAPNHPCSRIDVSPLMNGFLHMLHNRAGSRTDPLTSAVDVRNKGGVLTATNTPFESRYEGPFFNPDTVIEQIKSLRLHRENTQHLFDVNRWKDVKALFPVLVRRTEKRKRRTGDEEDSDDEATATAGEMDVYTMRKTAKAPKQ